MRGESSTRVVLFVPPVVSPGGVKRGRLLITRDEGDSYSSRVDKGQNSEITGGRYDIEISVDA